MGSRIKYTVFPLSDVHDNASAMTELLAVLKGLVGWGGGEILEGNRDRKIRARDGMREGIVRLSRESELL